MADDVGVSLPAPQDPQTAAAPTANAALQDQPVPQLGAPPSWDVISSDPSFQKLPAEQRLHAKETYFSQVIAPNLPSAKYTRLSDLGVHFDPLIENDESDQRDAAESAHKQMTDAYLQFMSYKPVQSGWGEYLTTELPKDVHDFLPKLYGYAKLARDWFGNSPGGNYQAALVKQYLDDPSKLSAQTREAIKPAVDAFKQRKAATDADIAPLREIGAQEAERSLLETPGQQAVSGTLDSAPDMAAAIGGQFLGIPAPVTFSATQALRSYGSAKTAGLSDEDALAHAGISAAANAVAFPVAEATGGLTSRLASKAGRAALRGVAGDRLASAAGQRLGSYVGQGTTMAGLGAATGGAEAAYDQYRSGRIDYKQLASQVGEEAAQGFVSGLVLAGAGHAASTAGLGVSAASGAVRRRAQATRGIGPSLDELAPRQAAEPQPATQEPPQAPIAAPSQAAQIVQTPEVQAQSFTRGARADGAQGTPFEGISGTLVRSQLNPSGDRIWTVRVPGGDLLQVQESQIAGYQAPPAFVHDVGRKVTIGPGHPAAGFTGMVDDQIPGKNGPIYRIRGDDGSVMFAPEGNVHAAPQQALPAPEPSAPGMAATRELTPRQGAAVPVSPAGQAITEDQRAEHASLGLTPDVAQAQRQHPAFAPLTPDETAVVANSEGIHPDDVPAADVAALVSRFEADPAAAQELVNRHESDATLAAAAKPGAEPAAAVTPAVEHAAAGQPAQQPPSANGERSTGAPARDETASQPEQPGGAEGEVGGEVRPPMPAPRAKSERPWINTDYNVPLGGGRDAPLHADGQPKTPEERKTYIDRGIPEWEWDPESKQWVNQWEEIDDHERAEEKHLDELGYGHAGDAHDTHGNAATQRNLERAGVRPESYARNLKPHLDQARQKAEAGSGGLPPDLDRRVYEKAENAKLLAAANKERSEPKKKSRLSPLEDPLLSDEGSRRMLTGMANQAGWTEGRPGTALRADRMSDVVGRATTKSAEQWFKDAQGIAPLPDNVTENATRAAVDKALAGEPMTAAERRHVGSMLDSIRSDQEDAELQGVLTDHELPEADAELVKLIARAHDILGERAVMRLSDQHLGDDEGYKRALQEAIDEHRAPEEAVGGRQGPGEPFALETHTEADLKARAAQEDLARRRREEEQARASAPSPESFKLTGSERAADVGTAAGQRDLGLRQEPAKAAPQASQNQISRKDGAAREVENVQSPGAEYAYGTQEPEAGVVPGQEPRVQAAGASSEPAGRRVEGLPGQLDLFTPESAKRIKAPESIARRVKAVRTGTFRSGINRVRDERDAAHVLAPLRKEAQESMLALVTDSDGKPLAIIRHSIGTTNAAHVERAILLGAIHNVDGAKQVWFAHNHPSGNPVHSSADRTITEQLASALAGTGIKAHGMLVVTPGGRATFMAHGEPTERATEIKPSARTQEVPVLGRRITRFTSGKSLNNSTEAEAEIAKIPDQSGVALLDTNHALVGFVPMDVSEMRNMRTGEVGSGASKLLRAIENTNAVSLIAKMPTEDRAAESNIAAFSRDTGIRHLDTIANEVAMSGTRDGLAEPSREPYFSREQVGSQADHAAASRSNEANDVAGLADRLSSLHGRPVRVWREPPADEASRALANAVRRMFGRRVEFIGSDDPGMRGAYIGGKTLFVNTAARKPHTAIIGHELLHSLRDEAPDVYNRLVSDLAGVVKDDAGTSFKRFLNELRAQHGLSQLDDTKLHEELIADVVGDHFADPRFVRQMQMSLEPNLFRRVAAHIMDFIDRVLSKVSGTPREIGRQAQRFVSDLKASRDAIAQALSDLGQEYSGSMEEQPSFSRESASKELNELAPAPKPRDIKFSHVDTEPEEVQDYEDRTPESPIGRSLNFMNSVLGATVKTFNPMAAGSDRAKASAKDWANADRKARWRFQKLDEYAEKHFTPERRQKMGAALDEMSVLTQMGQPTAGKGLDRLTPQERDFVERVNDMGKQIWRRATDVGLVDGEGIPYYMPRSLVNVDDDGRVNRLGGSGERRADFGSGLVKNSPNLRRRNYLLPNETEDAAKKKFGDGATLVTDIRALPLALARLERAVAGRELINRIRVMGHEAGAKNVIDSAEPGYFTLNHPAFETFRPKLIKNEETGKYEAATDQNGNTLFDRVPIYVSKEFEGPLRALMWSHPGDAERALMQIKAVSTGTIMYSPFIHLGVEIGRAFPAMPGKILTFKFWRDGNMGRNDYATMSRAIDGGLVPIGKRGAYQDLTSIASDPVLSKSKPAQSLFGIIGKAVASAVEKFNPEAADKLRLKQDALGEFYHNKLLWDRVADLQMGLYLNMERYFERKGLDAQTASRIAAHEANRFAGTLPREAMSQLSTRIANLTLFSRQFTLGNLGVLKDALTGLPGDIQAQIMRDAGPLMRKSAVSLARRKAIATVILDVGLMMAVNSLLQDFFNHLHGDTVSKLVDGYRRRLHDALNNVAEHPSELFNPFYFPERLSSTWDNEPGKQDRILVGHEADGTGIYMRLPFGKIGEEFKNWMTSPVKTVESKESTILRPIMETLTNNRAFGAGYQGRRVYDPEAHDLAGFAKNMGGVAETFMANMTPLDSMQSAANIIAMNGKRQDGYKVLGPMVGLVYSHGAPGGPQVGEILAQQAQQSAAFADRLPEINKQIDEGKVQEAMTGLEELGMTPREAYHHVINRQYHIMSRGRMQEFFRTASPEQIERYQRAVDAANQQSEADDQ